MDDPDSACAEAMRLQLSGRLEEAERRYRGALVADPRHAAANYGLGMLEVQRRQAAAGLAHLLAALEVQPESRDYWLGYLEALLQSGRLEEAGSTLRLGIEHGLAGEDVEHFEQRLSTHNRLERVRREEQALLSLVAQRRFADAQSLARSITGQFPEQGLAWKVLGTLLHAQGLYRDALVPLERGQRLRPDDAEARVNLAMNLFRLEQFDRAEEHLRAAIARQPDMSGAYFKLAMLLALRNRYTESEQILQRGFGLQAPYCPGDLDGSFSTLAFLSSHDAAIGATQLLAVHRRVGDEIEKRFRRSWPRHLNDRDPERSLRVGLMSSDLNDHSVAFFVEPVLENLAGRTSLELNAYYNNHRTDAVSERLRAHFRKWQPVANLESEELAAQVLEDRVDVLIDLCGHTGENRLSVFARKPAPLQVSWLGYPGTTGLEAMDYYLADHCFLPPGRFDRQFTEKLAYLPANWPVRSLDAALPVNRLPALATGTLSFGSFNRLGKLNPTTIALWCSVLRAVPNARLLVGSIDDGREPWLLDQFAAHGVDPARLRLHRRCTVTEYLRLHHQVDICLDTYPYSGGTTTVHALTMAVPTLGIAGDTPASRQTAGILGQLGLDEFIAAEPEGLLDRARYWAEHLDELAQLRQGIRDRWRNSPAGQPQLCADALERGLRHMWRRWCRGLRPTSFDL